MYSQNQEEVFIVNNLMNDHRKRFLDIGAYDGRTFSNTLALVERGWSGICIEPSPSVYPALFDLHKSNQNIKTINVAVGKINGSVKFFDSNGDAISTVNLDHKSKWEKNANVKFKEINVPMISIESMFNDYGKDFSFINLDVEGNSHELFCMLPLSDLKNLRLICVEHDSKQSKLISYASRYGFSQIHVNGENLILGK